MSDHAPNGNARWQTIAVWTAIGIGGISAYIQIKTELAVHSASLDRVETQMTRRGQMSYLRDHELWLHTFYLSRATGHGDIPPLPEYLYENGESGK